MKKFIALLLSALLCLSLTACIIIPEQSQNDDATVPTDTIEQDDNTAQDDTAAVPAETTEARIVFDATAAKPLIGTWKRVVTFNTADFGVEGVDEDFGVPLSVSFDDMGMYTVALDVEKFTETMVAYHTAIAVEALYAEYASQDMDQAAAAEDIMNTYGMTVEEYAKTSVEMTEFGSLLDGTTINSTYALVGETLYTEIDTDYPVAYSIKLEENTLTFLDGDKDVLWGGKRIPFPFQLARAE